VIKILHHNYPSDVEESPIKTQSDNINYLFAVNMDSAKVEGIKRLHTISRGWQI